MVGFQLWKWVPLVVLLMGGAAFGEIRQSVLEAEQALENRIASVVRQVDRKAVVIVKLKADGDQLSLPETPFFVSKMDLRDTNGKTLNFSEINITVYSALEPFPEDYRNFISEITAGIGPEAAIEVKPINVLDSEGTVVAGASGIEQLMASPMFRFGLPLAFGALVLVLLLGFGLLNRVVGGMKATLDAGVGRLASSLESGGFGGGGATAAQPAAPTTIQASLSSSGGNIFENLSEEGLLALMSDCYWSEQDTYGAYVWHRIPVKARRGLLTKLNFLPEYTSYLSSVEEANLNLEQDPYYLSPLELASVDNKALTDLVRKNPGLLNTLSSLRVNNLDLKPVERIGLAKKASEAGHSPANIGTPNPSQARKLKKKVQIQIRNIAEEKEILASKDITPEIMEGAVSLGWLAKLSDTVITDVLSIYTAKQLASAWIGPPEVLDKLASQIPKKKLELLDSYRTSANPSRESQTFIDIHAQTMLAMKQAKSNPSDKDANARKKAA